MSESPTFTAFSGSRCLATGDLETVARAVAVEAAPQGTVLVFDDGTGRAVDLDLRHGPAHAVADYVARSTPAEPSPRQGRGRPRLGVVAREVTLLPRHWDWLAAQPGGASAALRRLVDEARHGGEGAGRARAALDAAYRVMSALAGDAAGFEDAARALFAADDARFDAIVEGWPKDVAQYVQRLTQTARTERRQS